MTLEMIVETVFGWRSRYLIESLGRLLSLLAACTWTWACMLLMLQLLIRIFLWAVCVGGLTLHCAALRSTASSEQRVLASCDSWIPVRRPWCWLHEVYLNLCFPQLWCPWNASSKFYCSPWLKPGIYQFAYLQWMRKCYDAWHWVSFHYTLPPFVPNFRRCCLFASQR